ncbi:MAG: multidrug transporter [Candidatus Adlerbacteria bacterium]|nr:multidrug transporter [Candidatus Adlerbacteria bacterium]
MNYKLNQGENTETKGTLRAAFAKILPLMFAERKNMILACIAILINSGLTLVGPIIVGHTIDTYIRTGDYNGIVVFSVILLGIYLITFGAGYIQTTVMGGVGRRVLFNLRNEIFTKLSELPLAFFNANKSGDLISRINNDTDKLNQFFAQALMQFIGNIFVIIGAGIFLLALNVKLGIGALLPALGILIVTQLISPWIERTNLKSLRTLGSMSGEIQESLANFKVIVAFNRLDYFRNKFAEVNAKNFSASISAGLANNIFTPLYGFASNLAQMIVLSYGIYLIGTGQLTVGLLISFLLYVNNFYMPLRQIASIWSTFQLALASLDRISEVLALENTMEVLPHTEEPTHAKGVLEFANVSFAYENGKEVLRHTNIVLEKGKTYALVGPTGGGKTTTASLMARLYDPTEGTVLLNGRDIRTYTPQERSQKIGFILQEPTLFRGTVRDNLVYGSTEYASATNEDLMDILQEAGLGHLLERFDQGLATPVGTSSDSMSLGQRQLVAFIRAVLRKPELLILDEATANIDTVTEQLLEEVLKKLPSTTTRVIIAHRLNTIEEADEIFFINEGGVTSAGSMDHAVEMLLHGSRTS